ncbi:Uu.00g111490.m01.CDS01 [Anthostomella pinea]|uniref:Uu.00g111490.m01.CDS01 n=1 Tax=Anthostomella pinea TaxID=933095 RepID=A0AAI8VFM2_9PEZI|nr:Uu.00g111490.m01.CDS01 [Anthostomella pinea]
MVNFDRILTLIDSTIMSIIDRPSPKCQQGYAENNSHGEVGMEPIHGASAQLNGGKIYPIYPNEETKLDRGPIVRSMRYRRRSKTAGAGRSVLDLGKSHGFFLECAPTDDRLKELGKRWLIPEFLRRRLLYCGPFFIRFEEAESRNHLGGGASRLVTKNHHELSDSLYDGSSEGFAEQMGRAWPESFGSLITQHEQAPRFLWKCDAPHVDDNTEYVCRKSAMQGERQLLEVLFRGFKIYHGPSDDLLWQVMPKITTSVLSMSTIAFLESLFAPTHISHVGLGTLSDRFPIQATTPVLHSTGDFGEGDWLCVRFNMRACIPDDGSHRAKRFKNGHGISPESLGFPLKRQTARIPGFFGAKDQFAVEYLLSVAIVMRKRLQTRASSIVKHSVVVWLDYQTDFDSSAGRGSLFPALSDRVDLDLKLKDCGAGGDGIFEFLVVLVRAINHWRVCWDVTMGRIDDFVSIQLQDTLDRRRWETLMFDDSFQQSEQYFTVLQLLRIFHDYIKEVEEGIEDLREELLSQCRSWKAWRQRYTAEDEKAWPLDMQNLEADLESIKGFFDLRVVPLKERLERKKIEVESLRDGLLNAASLRETLKAKTLNLYIGVFTFVTVLFSPLGFMAAFWAIPFLAPSSQNATLGGFVTSFVAVPVITYLVSAAFIVYVWGRSSRSVGEFVYDQVLAATWAVYGRTVMALNQVLLVAKGVWGRSPRSLRRFAYDQFLAAPLAVLSWTFLVLDLLRRVAERVWSLSPRSFGRSVYDWIRAATRAVCGKTVMAFNELMHVAKTRKNTPSDHSGLTTRV